MARDVEFDAYFALVKQSVAHLDQRLNTILSGMTSLEKELQETRLALRAVELEYAKKEDIIPVQRLVAKVDEIQRTCPGRKVLRWSTLAGIVTILAMCTGVFFQWREVRQMRGQKPNSN